jgi:hypothetical protein
MPGSMVAGIYMAWGLNLLHHRNVKVELARQTESSGSVTLSMKVTVVLLRTIIPW